MLLLFFGAAWVHILPRLFLPQTTAIDGPCTASTRIGPAWERRGRRCCSAWIACASSIPPLACRSTDDGLSGGLRTLSTTRAASVSRFDSDTGGDSDWSEHGDRCAQSRRSIALSRPVAVSSLSSRLLPSSLATAFVAQCRWRSCLLGSRYRGQDDSSRVCGFQSVTSNRRTTGIRQAASVEEGDLMTPIRCIHPAPNNIHRRSSCYGHLQREA